MADGFAHLPQPPYWVVIFSSRLTPDDAGYGQMAQVMVDLALAQPGCLGIENARSPDGFGITTAYFRDEASILAWRRHGDHQVAQKLGRERWYSHYEVRVARVERAYAGPAEG